jgi:periplasmic protein TonB
MQRLFNLASLTLGFIVTSTAWAQSGNVSTLANRCEGVTPPFDKVQAIVRIAPKYPISAARDGVEGYVKMVFDVNKVGQTTNINAIESAPADVFVKEAINALAKWKYKPSLVNGVVMTTSCLTVQLDFKLG